MKLDLVAAVYFRGGQGGLAHAIEIAPGIMAKCEGLRCDAWSDIDEDLQPFMVERFGYKDGDFPITESISQRTIALPFYNNLTKEEIVHVCKTLKKVLDDA